ncbi:MAG: DUF262 domain-containing protein [Gammaproteobacteria bacterium]|nr:MAG: DUF262 domain-containing protein [Gammaproteobacteria bacterium]
MSEIFKPLSLTIKELFGNTDSLYQIPIYQRPYKWGSEQVDKLWEDLWDAFQNDEPNYFLGSVITAKPQESSNYLDVVDGQQRLTTLLILFCCYRDVFPEINKDADDPFAVDSNILSNSIFFNGKFNRLKLVTHASHQSDFESVVIKGDTTKCKEPTKSQLAKDEEPKFKFANTSALFCQLLRDLDEATAGEFLNYVFNKVRIIRIDCSSVNFAIKLFQVLNDRGLDLTNSDLIKSFLLEKVYRKYAEDEATLKLRADQFIADWRATENIVKDSYLSMNDLFVIYEYYLLASNPRKSLYDELQTAFATKDPNEVIADFKKFAEHHKNSIVDLHDKTIYSFWYLKWTVYWKSILLAALHTKYPDYERLVKALRRYYYLNWIAGFTMTRIKQISFNLIKWVKDKEPMSFIEKQINDKLASDGVIPRAISQLDSDIYYASWCKPLLVMIEYNQTDNSMPQWIDIKDRDLHVEHILPRKFTDIRGWEHFFSNDEVPKWINSGGNLTLLSGKKNIEASNNSFPVKIDVYKGKGKHSDSDKKVTAFRISQKLVDDFEAGKYSKNWTMDSMIDRWNWFLNEVEQVLAIDLSTIKHNPPVPENEM